VLVLFAESSDIAIHAKEILRVRERLNKIYQKHMTKPLSLQQIGANYRSPFFNLIESLVERDYFMNAEEALDLGLVDKVLHEREKPSPSK